MTIHFACPNMAALHYRPSKQHYCRDMSSSSQAHGNQSPAYTVVFTPPRHDADQIERFSSLYRDPEKTPSKTECSTALLASSESNNKPIRDPPRRLVIVGCECKAPAGPQYCAASSSGGHTLLATPAIG